LGSAIGPVSVCDARGAVNEILTGLKGDPMREFHARCVKISRISPPQKNPQAVLLAFLQKNGWHRHC